MLIDFDPVHIHGMNLRHHDALTIGALPTEQSDALARVYQGAGPSYTLVHEGVVVAVGGVILLWQGVGEAWLLTSEETPNHAKAFHKGVKTMLQATADKFDLHRVQASVRTDHQVGIRYLERLGFQLEGVMNQYGPDRGDHHLYARAFK